MTHGNKPQAGQLQLGHADIKGDYESLPFIPAQKSGDEWQLVCEAEVTSLLVDKSPPGRERSLLYCPGLLRP